MSHSRVEVYKACPKKYKFQFIDKYVEDKTYSPLLFGKALDEALNYVLQQFKDKQPIVNQYAKDIFLKNMNLWNAQNELVFFKSEIPKADFIDDDPDGNQLRAWTYLCRIGQMMIDTYTTEVLPLVDEVVELQKKVRVKNEEGDTFTLVLDAILKFKDGREVLVDNKSASKPYELNSVKESTQLAIYNEHFPVPYAGYIVMHKKLTDNKITWQLIIDTVDETKKQEAFDNIDIALKGIKAGKFDKNTKSCYSYGKQCPYYKACHYSNYKGLKKQK